MNWRLRLLNLIVIVVLFTISLMIIIAENNYSNNITETTETTEIIDSYDTNEDTSYIGENEVTVPDTTFEEEDETEVVETTQDTIPVDTDNILREPPMEEVYAIARTLYGECRGMESAMEKAAVAWCILNRVDAQGYGFGYSVEYVLNFPYQFHGYSSDYPLLDELVDLSRDVMIRWYREKDGETDVGRVLPKEYLWFHGDGVHNHFRDAYEGGNTWDWSLENPYED